jgi:hypothetical protein
MSAFSERSFISLPKDEGGYSTQIASANDLRVVSRAARVSRIVARGEIIASSAYLFSSRGHIAASPVSARASRRKRALGLGHCPVCPGRRAEHRKSKLTNVALTPTSCRTVARQSSSVPVSMTRGARWRRASWLGREHLFCCSHKPGSGSREGATAQKAQADCRSGAATLDGGEKVLEGPTAVPSDSTTASPGRTQHDRLVRLKRAVRPGRRGPASTQAP